MTVLSHICSSLKSLCVGNRRRRGGMGLWRSSDALESRQLMTVVMAGFMEVEPNNSMAQANEMVTIEPTLTSGISANLAGHIGHAGDNQDLFRLNLSENVINARVIFNHSIRQNLNMQLMNESGSVISSANRLSFGSKMLQAASLPAGTYYIRVFRSTSTAASQWSATLTGTRVGAPAAAPESPSSGIDVEPNNSRALAGSLGTLTPDVSTVVRGSLTGSDPEDWYRVPVDSSGALTIQLTGMTADLDLEVQDSNGATLRTSSNGSNDNETIALTGLSAGDYFIRIKRFLGASSNYTLTAVANSSASTPGTNTSMETALNLGSAAAGGSVTANGNLYGGTKWYRFQTANSWNGTLTLGSVTGTPSQQSVRNLPAGTYYVSISSNLIGSNFIGQLYNSTGASLQTFTGAQSGETFRVAVAVQNVTPPTPVILSEQESNDSRWTATAFGALTAGTTAAARGSLSSRETDDWFKITLDGRSSLTVELSMENGSRGSTMNRLDRITHLQLTDQFGNVIADSSRNSTMAYRNNLRSVTKSSLAAGTYYLRVFRSSTGMASPYRLTVTPQAL
ncbi:MAG: PPC domain-containing protein [Planctomyces sp.]|nr:PPC domain-containing protein [Planctomyces sp.]